MNRSITILNFNKVTLNEPHWRRGSCHVIRHNSLRLITLAVVVTVEVVLGSICSS
jgi:hypothetical protein